MKTAEEFLKKKFPTTYKFLNDPREAAGMLGMVVMAMEEYASQPREAREIIFGDPGDPAQEEQITKEEQR